MAVPFIDLKRFESDFLKKWDEKCSHISKNTMFVGGPEAANLEKRLQEESGVAEVVGCANGTDAIQLALRAVGVEEGDIVLLPDATFWATFESVVNVGARPVTVDIDPDDLQMDFHLFKKAVEKYQPKAAIIVHLYGWGSAKLDQFRSYCKEKNVLLIEDGAQAFGVKYKGESIYKDALISTISFYPAKVLGSCGDAGAVYCSTKELANTIRCLGNHGRTSHYGHGLVGWNSRMGGFDAAYLNLCLDNIEARLDSRKKMAMRFQDDLEAMGIKVVRPPADYIENGYLNVTLHDPAKRPAIEAILKENGIGFGNVYPGSMSTQPAAEKYLHGKVGGENADLLSKSVLNLPLFAYMKEEEYKEVLETMQKAMSETEAGVR